MLNLPTDHLQTLSKTSHGNFLEAPVSDSALSLDSLGSILDHRTKILQAPHAVKPTKTKCNHMPVPQGLLSQQDQCDSWHVQ